MVEVSVGVPEDGLKLAEAPAGRPLAESETATPKSPMSVTVILEVVELPRLTVLEDGLTLRLKSPPNAYTFLSSEPM